MHWRGIFLNFGKEIPPSSQDPEQANMNNETIIESEASRNAKYTASIISEDAVDFGHPGIS